MTAKPEVAERQKLVISSSGCDVGRRTAHSHSPDRAPLRAQRGIAASQLRPRRAWPVAVSRRLPSPLRLWVAAAQGETLSGGRSSGVRLSCRSSTRTTPRRPARSVRAYRILHHQPGCMDLLKSRTPLRERGRARQVVTASLCLGPHLSRTPPADHHKHCDPRTWGLARLRARMTRPQTSDRGSPQPSGPHELDG